MEDNKLYLYNDYELQDDNGDVNLAYKWLKEDIEKLLDRSFLVCTGKMELWNGQCPREKVVEEYTDFATLLEAYNVVYIENGILYLEATHHDGTNRFVFRLLNKRGMDYYMNHQLAYEDDRQAVVEKLNKPPYSTKIPKIF